MSQEIVIVVPGSLGPNLPRANTGHLATIWQQYWPCHPNATTMSKLSSREIMH